MPDPEMQKDLKAVLPSEQESRRMLLGRHLKAQIDLRLQERQGSVVTNFVAALASPDVAHTLQAIKDPHVSTSWSWL